MALIEIGPTLSPGQRATRETQLANMLMQARRPVRHWSDGLFNAANTIAGAYLSKRAAADTATSMNNRRKVMAKALMKALGGNTGAIDTAGMSGDVFAAPKPGPVAGPYPLDMPRSVVMAESKNDLEMARDANRQPAQTIEDRMSAISPQAGPGSTTTTIDGQNRTSPTVAMAMELMKNPDTFEAGYNLATRALADREKLAQESAARQTEFDMRGRLEQLKYGMDPRKQWMTIPGLGVFNVQTGELKTPYGSTASAQSQGGQSDLAMLSPRGREQIAIDAAKTSRKQIEKLSKEASDMQKMAEMADQFDKLLDVQETGGVLLNIPGAETVAKAMGDKELSTMYAITNFLTPLMRQGLPGAASDRDVAIFRGATISPDKPVETNRIIARGLIEAAKNKRQELEFKSDYLAKHGNLDGADALWQRYLDDNRIFVGDGRGGLSLNPNRRAWREYFGAMQGEQNQTVMQPPAQSQMQQQEDDAAHALPPGFRLMGQ